MPQDEHRDSSRPSARPFGASSRLGPITAQVGRAGQRRPMSHVIYRCSVFEVGGHLLRPSIYAVSASVAELNLITNPFEGFRADGNPNLGGTSWKATPTSFSPCGELRSGT